MARKRTIDIEGLLFDSELIQALSLKGIILYEVMWGNADDWGGLEINYYNLKLKMGAVKVTVKEIENEVTKLIKLNKLIPYEADKKYGWIKNFLKHQHLNNPSLPTIPLPEWITYEVREYPSKKKYAVYTVITEKLPVGYQYTTSNTETKPIETNRNRKETEKKLYQDFVYLTDKEYSSLRDRFGETGLKDWISRLNNYIGSTGKKYKSHSHTILTWAAKEGNNGRNRQDVTYKQLDTKTPERKDINPEGLKKINELVKGVVKKCK